MVFRGKFLLQRSADLKPVQPERDASEALAETEGALPVEPEEPVVSPPLSEPDPSCLESSGTEAVPGSISADDIVEGFRRVRSAHDAEGPLPAAEASEPPEVDTAGAEGNEPVVEEEAETSAEDGGIDAFRREFRRSGTGGTPRGIPVDEEAVNRLFGQFHRAEEQARRKAPRPGVIDRALRGVRPKEPPMETPSSGAPGAAEGADNQAEARESAQEEDLAPVRPRTGAIDETTPSAAAESAEDVGSAPTAPPGERRIVATTTSVRDVSAEHAQAPWRGPERPLKPALSGTGMHPVYADALDYVLESVRSVQRGGLPDLSRGLEVVSQLRASLQLGSELLLAATDRFQPFAISNHAVNVTILALRVARALKLDSEAQRRVGLAAILHEVGVTRLPAELSYRRANLSQDELKALRQRPLYSYQVLREVPEAYSWLPEVVGQVYERADGSGVPLGLKGEAIAEEAQIIGIADVFDACVHSRPEREGMTGYQTLFELSTDYAAAFPDRILKALIRSLSLYPYNEFVELDSGEIGRVVEINAENLSRPQVEVLYGSVRVRLSRPYTLDLGTQADRYVSQPLRLSEVPG